MTLSTDDVQTSSFQHRFVALFPLTLDRRNLFFRWIFKLSHFRFPVTTQHNVGTTTGHVGCDGNSPRATGVSNDLGFTRVFFRVQNIVWNLFFLEQLRHVFGGLNRCRTNQHRALLLYNAANFFNHRVVFFRLGSVDDVIMVETLDWLVGRNNHNIQPIDLVEFERFGICGTCHTRQFFVEAEVILEGCRGQRLAFRLNIDVFLCFDGLMQTFPPATPWHGTASVFINNHNLTVTDDVVDVLLVDNVCTQS